MKIKNNGVLIYNDDQLLAEAESTAIASWIVEVLNNHIPKSINQRDFYIHKRDTTPNSAERKYFQKEVDFLDCLSMASAIQESGSVKK